MMWIFLGCKIADNLLRSCSIVPFSKSWILYQKKLPSDIVIALKTAQSRHRKLGDRFSTEWNLGEGGQDQIILVFDEITALFMRILSGEGPWPGLLTRRLPVLAKSSAASPTTCIDRSRFWDFPRNCTTSPVALSITYSRRWEPSVRLISETN